MKKVNCEICNKEFLICPSREKKNKHHTCSKLCMGKFSSKIHSTKIKTNCIICCKEIFYKKSHFKNRRYHTCSHSCMAKVKSKIFRGENNPKALKLGTKERLFWDRCQDIKHRSWTKNIEFDLTDDFILEMFEKQKGLCYYTGYPMRINGKKNFDGMSVDKIDPNKGYIKSNVVLCLYCINMMKSDNSIDDIYDVFKYIAQKYKI